MGCIGHGPFGSKGPCLGRPENSKFSFIIQLKQRICEKKMVNFLSIDLLDPEILHGKDLGILGFPTMPATFVERIVLIDGENMLLNKWHNWWNYRILQCKQ